MAAGRERKTGNRQCFTFKCKVSCCFKCSYCAWAFTKERNKSRGSRLLLQKLCIKTCEKCFLCHSIVLYSTCNKCQKCCLKSACKGQTSKLLAKLAGSGGRSKNSTNLERGLHSSISDPAKSYNPHRNSYLLEALQPLIDNNAVELVHNQTSLGFFNRLFLVPKPNNRWRPILDLSKLNLFLRVEKFKMETPETIRTSPQQGEWVTSVDFKDAYFHIPIQEQSRKYLFFFQISCPGSDLPIQSTAIWSVHSSHGIHCVSKGGETDGHTQGYKNPPVPRRLVGKSQIPPNPSPTHPNSSQDVPESGLAGECGKSELEPKQVFDFVGYQFDLRSGRVRPTPDRLQSLQEKIQALLLLLTCLVRQFMSLIGLLTATEKQVHLGRLHMRPMQWHLKNNWRVIEFLEKIIPLPRSLHPHLQWWLEESNVLKGQPLHPLKHALQIFTDASKEGWGVHLNEHTARGSWSVPESKLHINYLELKAVFLALKEFQDLCVSKIVLVATDNMIVVAYINKEGGMRSGPLCALLWRILSWCTQRQVTLKARHIPSCLNVIADKLSRLAQTIQTEWSLLPEVFQMLCNKWHRPQTFLLRGSTTSYLNLYPRFRTPWL